MKQEDANPLNDKIDVNLSMITLLAQCHALVATAINLIVDIKAKIENVDIAVINDEIQELYLSNLKIATESLKFKDENSKGSSDTTNS